MSGWCIHHSQENILLYIRSNLCQDRTEWQATSFPANFQASTLWYTGGGNEATTYCRQQFGNKFCRRQWVSQPRCLHTVSVPYLSRCIELCIVGQSCARSICMHSPYCMNNHVHTALLRKRSSKETEHRKGILYTCTYTDTHTYINTQTSFKQLRKVTASTA